MAGIPQEGLCIDSLRGTTISELARQGAHQRCAQEIVGQKDPWVTQGIYTQMSLDDGRAEVEKLPHRMPGWHKSGTEGGDK